MPRIISHSQKKEPALEKILGILRYKKTEKYIPFESTVLDLGCGYCGSFLKRIAWKIEKGVGLDISVDPNQRNKKIRLIAHDLNEKITLTDESFDIVTSLANMEHLENPDIIFQEICRVLKPRGFLILTTPTKSAKPLLEILAFFRIISKKEIKDHKHYFSKAKLIMLCKKSGFQRIQHKYFQVGMNNLLIARK